MERDQALELIKILSIMYRNSGFEQEIKREIYIKQFAKYDYQIAYAVVEKLLIHHRFCPTPSEFKEAYETEVRNRKYQDVLTPKNNSCKVCHGKGYVLEMRIDNELPYEFMLYCDQCPAGDYWKYDGRTIVENRSLYYINPVGFRGGEVSLEELPEKWIPESKHNAREKLTKELAENFYL